MSEVQVRWRRRLFGALLAVLILAQLLVIAQTTLPELARIRQDLGKSGGWRGANFAFNLETADYLEWLNRQIPAEAEVLVAADTGPEQLSRPADLQVFLYPRRLYNCPGAAYTGCVQAALEAGRPALVTTPERLAELIAAHPQSYQAFNEQWGLLYAGPAAEAALVLRQDFGSLGAVALSALAPLAALALVTLAGFNLLSLLAPDLEGGSQMALGFGLGSASYSLLVFLALLAGLDPSPELLAAILLLLLLAPLPAWRRLQAAWAQRAFHFNWPIALALLALAGLTLALAAGRGYARSDEYLLWGAKGYGILAAGLQTGVSDWGTLTTQYPLNLPLLISSLVAGFGEQLPQSKLLFPFYYLGLIVVAWAFLRRRLSGNWSLAGAALLASAPLVFQHASLAYANLPFAFYLAGGLLLAVDAPGQGRAWLAGLLLAAAAWTRPEGQAILWVLLPVLILLTHGRRTLRRWADWLPLLAPLAAYSLFWWLAAPLAYTRGGFSQGLIGGGLGTLLAGNLNWSEAAFLLQQFGRQLLSFQDWAGLALLTLPLLLLLAAGRRKAISSISYRLLLLGLLFIAIILASYYLTSYRAQGADISWWVSTGLNRMLMPGMILAGLGAYLATAEALDLHRPIHDDGQVTP